MATNRQQEDVNAAIQAYLDRSQWRQQLALDYQDTTNRLLQSYTRILPRLQSAAGDFTGQLADYFAANGQLPDAERTRGLKTYQDLLARVEAEMRDFGALTSSEAGFLSDKAIVTGIDAATENVQFTAGNRAGVVASVWNRPDPGAIANAAGYVDSPAFRLKAGAFGANAAENIGDVIISGIAQGKSPAAITSLLQNWFSVPYSWGINTVRTTQLYSYRFSSHESYVQNSDVITGWMWWASLDDRTCLSCISQHGQVFPLNESLNDHHLGRCAELPIVIGSTWMSEVKPGADWFAEQDAATQRRLMGPGRLEMYNAGMWDWGRASVPYQNDIFGTMRRAATLEEMTG